MVIIFFIIFLLGVLFLVSPLQIRIIIQQSPENDEIGVRFNLLWGLVKLKTTLKSLGIGLEKIISLIEFTGILGKMKSDQKLKSSINWQYFVNILQQIDFKAIVKLWHLRKNFLPPLKNFNITWITRVGFQDAAMTGMVTGILWSLKGMIFSVIKQLKSPVEKTEILVIPDFKHNIFEMLLDCIFRITIGHIILAGLKICYYLVVFRLKGGEANGRPSNRSANENGYGKY